MKIGLVHEFLITWGGSDFVLEQFHRLYPDAPIFTAIHKPEVFEAHFTGADIRTSFLQKMPGAASRHRLYLPLFPLAFEGFDLDGLDVVLSSHHMCAKGVLTQSRTCHICFCHSPMRYAWDLFHEYQRGLKPVSRALSRALLHRMRLWDVATANRVDYFIANAHNVANRIRKHYRREAEVIHSPVDVGRFEVSEKNDGYYLAVSRLVPYKRIDLAVEAFNRLGERLVVVGDGPEMRRIKELAGKNIEILGFVSDEEIIAHYRNCKAFVFPGEEDFGITPLEAQACGKPVIAYGAGGALETVKDGKTGVFFNEQTPASLEAAVRAFDAGSFDPAEARKNAEAFDVAVFREKIDRFVREKQAEYRERLSR